MMERFGVAMEDLYQLWMLFTFCRLKGMNLIDIMKKIRSTHNVKTEVLDYFTFIGLEQITEEISENGKECIS